MGGGIGMRATSPRSGSTVRRPLDSALAVTRYDLVLAVIPLALAAGGVLGAAPSIPDLVGVVGGGVVALAATAYALLVDPPIGRREELPRGSRYRNAD